MTDTGSLLFRNLSAAKTLISTKQALCTLLPATCVTASYSKVLIASYTTIRTYGATMSGLFMNT